MVTAALKKLEDSYEDERKEAEETIDEYGLTIEVARLRDRLDRVASSDMERLLLSTPGVAEKLFNKAIEKEVEEEQEEEESGEESEIERDELIGALLAKLDKLDKLDEIADALKERDETESAAASAVAAENDAPARSGAKTTAPRRSVKKEPQS